MITRVALAATLLTTLSAAWAGTAPGPVGWWQTEDGDGVIRVESCGDALCGRIVGIRRLPGAPVPRDWEGRPECGLEILRDEKPADDGRWRGTITDPRNGTVYHAILWLDDDGALRVRGYVGIPLLGQTQTWHRYEGALTPDCAMLSGRPPRPDQEQPPTRAYRGS